MEYLLSEIYTNLPIGMEHFVAVENLNPRDLIFLPPRKSVSMWMVDVNHWACPSVNWFASFSNTHIKIQQIL